MSCHLWRRQLPADGQHFLQPPRPGTSFWTPARLSYQHFPLGSALRFLPRCLPLCIFICTLLLLSRTHTHPSTDTQGEKMRRAEGQFASRLVLFLYALTFDDMFTFCFIALTFSYYCSRRGPPGVWSCWYTACFVAFLASHPFLFPFPAAYRFLSNVAFLMHSRCRGSTFRSPIPFYVFGLRFITSRSFIFRHSKMVSSESGVACFTAGAREVRAWRDVWLPRQTGQTA